MSSAPLHCVVTGGASGLGRAVVSRFLRNRPNSLVASIDLAKSSKTESDQLRLLEIEADVKDEKSVELAVQRVSERFSGRVDVLVNCAGIARAFRTYNHAKNRFHSLGELKDVFLDDFQKVLDVNVVGTFNVIRLFCPLLASGQGMAVPCPENLPQPEDESPRDSVIINTSSIAAFEGQIGQVAYAASKGAINSMTLPLARDLSMYGIRVCAVAPGIFLTPLIDQSIPERAKKFLAKTMLWPRRLGLGEDFAHLVDSIVDNRYLNGEVIRLDAGLRLPA